MRSTLRVLAFALATVAVTIWVGTASAMVAPIDLQSTTRVAGSIFGGTVVGIRSYWSSDRSTILTEVTFSRVRRIKGPGSGRVTIKYQGGKVGHDEVVAAEQPTFEVGKRYVIFAYPNAEAPSAWIPIVGLYLGYFPVKPERGTGSAVVHNWSGLPVARIERGRLVLVDPESEPAVAELPSTTLHRGLRKDRGPAPPPEPPPTPLLVPTPGSSVPGERLPSPPEKYAARPSLPPRPESSSDQEAWILLKRSHDPGTRLSEEQFLLAIQSLL